MLFPPGAPAGDTTAAADAPVDESAEVLGVDPTLAEMAAQAAVELSSMQSLADMREEIDEAQAELRLARQSLGVAQATVDSASAMLATLGGVVAGLESDLARFDALPQAQRSAEAAALYVARCPAHTPPAVPAWFVVRSLFLGCLG